MRKAIFENNNKIFVVQQEAFEKDVLNKEIF